MKLNDMHNAIVGHYQKARILKSKHIKQVESIVGQTYKKKTKQIDQSSPLEDFLRNEQHIAVQQQPLFFRTLPRKLKVYFPGPPAPPPKLQQIPYTYEQVPSVPFKMPKQKPGYVGDWVLQQSRFVQRKSEPPRKNKSMIQSYNRNGQVKQNKSVIVNHFDKRSRFKSQFKRIVGQMKVKNLCLKQIIKNKGLVKKTHNFYNSVDFFLMCRSGDMGVEDLLQKNPDLAFDVDDQYMTGLHWAARCGHANICRMLTQKYRANCHAKDCYGRTPLHLAVQHKNIQCIIRIFIQGGHLTAMNRQGKSVRKVAKDVYIKYLIEKLEQIKLVIKSKYIKANQDVKNPQKAKQKREQEKAELETAIRNTLDQSSLYF